MRTISFLSSIIIGALGGLLVGCSSNDEPTTGNADPIVPDAVMTEWLDAQRQTGMDVMRQLAHDSEEDNLVYSPMSMYCMMSMLAAGADGECTRELAVFLNSSSSENTNKYNADILSNFPKLDNKATLTFANSLWISDKLVPNEVYKETLESYFVADLLNADMHTVAGTQTINGWIADKTQKLIERHFNPEESLESDICLVNAIYFKAPWSEKFDIRNTKTSNFTCTDGSLAKVQMMNDASMSGRYIEIDGTQVLSLPYGNGSFSAVFILPPADTDVREYVARTSVTDLMKRLPTQKSEVRVSIPKFEFNQRIDLKPVLENMGITEIFKPQMWRGIIASDNEIEFKKVSQSVVVKVDEDGATAAASSSINDTDSSPGPGPEFRADRPFIFVISEVSCNIPLFMGTVEKF